ncbi:29886_t:CDS:1, partial [Racocetra persica]
SQSGNIQRDSQSGNIQRDSQSGNIQRDLQSGNIQRDSQSGNIQFELLKHPDHMYTSKLINTKEISVLLERLEIPDVKII